MVHNPEGATTRAYDNLTVNGSPDDLEAYVLNSKYRQYVIEHLAVSDKSTPKRIAERTDYPRPHISRALSELRDKDLVELLVSEHKSVGRYYGLTEPGDEVWNRIKDQIRNVSWSFESPADEQSEALVELAKNEFGDALRFVAEHRQNVITFFYADEEAREEYSEDDIEEVHRKFIFQLPLNDASLPNAELQSEAKDYGYFVMVRVPISESHSVSITCDGDTQYSFPQIATEIQSIYN